MVTFPSSVKKKKNYLGVVHWQSKHIFFSNVLLDVSIEIQFRLGDTGAVVADDTTSAASTFALSSSTAVQDSQSSEIIIK